MIQTAAIMANQIEKMEGLPPETEPPPPEARKTMRPPMGPGIFDDDDSWAGTLSAQPRLADGTRMDDAIGFAFALVGTEAALADVRPGAGSLWEDLGVRVIAQSSGEVVRGPRARMARCCCDPTVTSSAPVIALRTSTTCWKPCGRRSSQV